MNKEKITIWGREFYLPAILECYPGESVLDSQQEALHWLLQDSEAIEASKTAVEEYLKKMNPEAAPDGKIANIFKFVMPKSIYAPHDAKRSSIAIMCDYKFDMEHGLAVVYQDKKFKAVGPQDIVL